MRGEDYLNFVEEVVMSMLDDMPFQSRLDGAPGHFTLPVRQWLHHHFPGR